MASEIAASFQALTKGITSWKLPKTATPCELLLTGEAAFPVLVNEEGKVLIAAASYGKGRMVVTSHEAYLMDTALTSFILNSVRWLCPSPGIPVGVHPSLKDLPDILKRSGVQTEIRGKPRSPPGVYCLNAYIDTITTELIQFVKAGGGLFIGGQAWFWVRQNGRDHLLSRFPGSQVTSVGGVYFLDTVGDTSPPKVSKNVPEIPHLVRIGQDLSKDQKQILKGIYTIHVYKNGHFSHLLVHGPLAFPLVVDPSLGCFLAAAYYGRGRVVVTSHEEDLENSKLGNFLSNAVRWLARGQTGKIGVNKELPKLHTLLSRHKVSSILQPQLSRDVCVYCCKANSDKEAQQLHEFVAEGGGLLTGAQSWRWASQHPNESVMARFPGNVILNRLGVSILPRTIIKGDFRLPPSEKPSSHFRQALSEFLPQLPPRGKSLNKNWMNNLVTDIIRFLQIPALGVPAYESVRRLLLKKFIDVGFPAVNKEHPVVKDSWEAAIISVSTEMAHSGTDCSQLLKGVDGVTGEPPQKPITVEIDGNNPGKEDGEHAQSLVEQDDVLVHDPGEDYCWVSTGLYLPSGRSAEVSVSQTLSSSGLKIQVGCHTDNLSNATKLFRAPVITHKYSINRTSQSITGLWGGLLYIILPKGSQLGPQSVTIKGAVPAPYFKLGKTSLEEWKHCIQESRAPWGELVSDNIILTVPSEDLRSLEHPGFLLHFWDQMMLAIARLGAQPFPFLRPERIVVDVQIAAGEIRSGYPIMAVRSLVRDLIDESHMRNEGVWRPIHELGHNQQRKAWEFPPHTTESTCNLWSVYVHEMVLGKTRAQVHPELTPDKRVKRIEKHLNKGAPLSDLKEFTALESYLQLQEAFGWMPFTEVFAEYQILSEIPKDNAGKMNLWVKKFSEKVQKNLVPFFKAWGWPIQKEVSESLSSLPEWETNPMRMYLNIWN